MKVKELFESNSEVSTSLTLYATVDTQLTEVVKKSITDSLNKLESLAIFKNDRPQPDFDHGAVALRFYQLAPVFYEGSNIIDGAEWYEQQLTTILKKKKKKNSVQWFVSWYTSSGLPPYPVECPEVRITFVKKADTPLKGISKLIKKADLVTISNLHHVDTGLLDVLRINTEKIDFGWPDTMELKQGKCSRLSRRTNQKWIETIC